jgi:hypothetical protein
VFGASREFFGSRRKSLDLTVKQVLRDARKLWRQSELDMFELLLRVLSRIPNVLLPQVVAQEADKFDYKPIRDILRDTSVSN